MAVPSPEDHQAVCSTIYRYALGVDTRDWTLYRSIFIDEVEIDMSSFNGLPGRRLSADVWVDQVAVLMESLDATQHLMANPLVEVESDEAVCTMYVQAEHTLKDRWYTIGGFYTDRLQREDQGWKINSVKLTVQWRRGDPSILAASRRPSSESKD